MTKKDYKYVFLFYIINSALIMIVELERFINFSSFNYYFIAIALVLLIDIFILTYTFLIQKKLESLPSLLAIAVIFFHSAIWATPALEYAFLSCELDCSKIGMILRVFIIEVLILAPLFISHFQVRKLERTE